MPISPAKDRTASRRAESIWTNRAAVLPFAVEISRLTEPADRVLQRLPVRPRAKAEVAFGLGRSEEHAVFGHAEAVQGRKRLASGEPSHPFRNIGDRNCCGAGDTKARRTAADQVRDVGEHIGEQDIRAAENVALADDT